MFSLISCWGRFTVSIGAARFWSFFSRTRRDSEELDLVQSGQSLSGPALPERRLDGQRSCQGDQFAAIDRLLMVRGSLAFITALWVEFGSHERGQLELRGLKGLVAKEWLGSNSMVQRFLSHHYRNLNHIWCPALVVYLTPAPWVNIFCLKNLFGI